MHNREGVQNPTFLVAVKVVVIAVVALSNVAGQMNQFDEFRVGTSIADVTGVPEPASVLLVALGGMMVARRRRQVCLAVSRKTRDQRPASA